jgi:hypothetical protein
MLQKQQRKSRWDEAYCFEVTGDCSDGSRVPMALQHVRAPWEGVEVQDGRNEHLEADQEVLVRNRKLPSLGILELANAMATITAGYKLSQSPSSCRL